MKTIKLSSLPLPVWVVELPEMYKPIVVDNIQHFGCSSVVCAIKDEYGVKIKHLDLPKPYKYELLGKLSDLTEQQFEGLVHTSEIYDPVRFPWGDGIAYKNYTKDIWGWSAKESFFSAIEAEGWYVNGNPHGTKPHKMDYSVLTEEFDKDLERWRESQEKVIDLNRCYVFISDIEAKYKRNVDAYAKEKFRK